MSGARHGTRRSCSHRKSGPSLLPAQGPHGASTRVLRNTPLQVTRPFSLKRGSTSRAGCLAEQKNLELITTQGLRTPCRGCTLDADGRTGRTGTPEQKVQDPPTAPREGGKGPGTERGEARGLVTMREIKLFTEGSLFNTRTIREHRRPLDAATTQPHPGRRASERASQKTPHGGEARDPHDSLPAPVGHQRT